MHLHLPKNHEWLSTGLKVPGLLFLTSSPTISLQLTLFQLHSCTRVFEPGAPYTWNTLPPGSAHGSLLDSSRSLFKCHMLTEAISWTYFLKLQPHAYVDIPFPRWLAGWLISWLIFTQYISSSEILCITIHCLLPSTPNNNVNSTRKTVSVLISARSLEHRTVPTIKQVLNKYLLNEERGNQRELITPVNMRQNFLIHSYMCTCWTIC